MTAYDLKSLDLPRLYGTQLELFASVVENPLGQALLMSSLLENGGIPKLRRLQLSETPTLYPIETSPVQQNAPLPNISFEDCKDYPRPPIPYLTIRDYAAAYHDGRTNPLDIAEKVLDAVGASEQLQPPLRAFIAMRRDDILAQASVSAERLRQGKPLSILDGVPVAV
jgi:hypothetical protein